MDPADDTHICLKCHTTIIGLDNYIDHRRNTSCKPSKPAEPEYPLRADDFFSSLELQSSSKPPVQTRPPRILTRSKTANLTHKDSGGSDVSDDDFEDSEDEDDAPPRTGGKWKPPEIGWWNEPPAGHTGGKWGAEDDEEAPPPNHTKGKWVPGRGKTAGDELLRKSAGTVQYWCESCNRVLSSKLLYERHLKTHLHQKRRKIDSEIAVKSGIRSRKLIRCEVCRLKILKHLMGKHLISHYHWRKSKINLKLAHSMVLDHIESLVLQSPFQCQPCRFYCNFESEFLQHWRSGDHLEQVENTGGFFYCSYCEFRVKDSSKMLTHLEESGHQEVIQAINRSVPIIIHKRSDIICPNCSKQFRYNIQLRRHGLTCGGIENSTASDKYQERQTCSECNSKFRSAIAFQRHLKRKHQKSIYVCTKCKLHFYTKSEAKTHRKTSKHQIHILNQKKHCNFCPEILSNIFDLKKHLLQKHPDLIPKCPQCGIKFPLPQQVTSHLRAKLCVYSPTFPEQSYKCKKCQFRTDSQSEFMFHEVLHQGGEVTDKGVRKFKCPLCPKKFRKASLRCHLRVHTSERPFICSDCGVGFARKSNLVDHRKNIHSQVEEKVNAGPSTSSDSHASLVCSTCGKTFCNKFVLQQHIASHEKSVKCPKPGCIYSARSFGVLQTHLQTHSIVKTYSCHVCTFSTKTQNLLQRHMKQHQPEKEYKCPDCPFKARFSNQLRLHFRKHTGAKPYKCPHCQYASATLENLRKHVLSTKKHPGQFLYECKFCQNERFRSNFAVEMRTHLFTCHNDEFHSIKAAASYVSGIYDPQDDEVKEMNKSTEEECTIYLPSTSGLTSFMLDQESELLQFEVVEAENVKDLTTYIEIPVTIAHDWTMGHNFNDEGILIQQADSETEEN